MSQIDLSQSNLQQEYRAELSTMRVRNTKVGCILALILWPAGISLDLLGYPSLFSQLLAVRLTCISILAVTLCLLFTEFGKRQNIFFGNVFAITPAFGISLMVYLVEGANSPFYAGLNLVILGSCLLLPYTFFESLVYCSVVLASYLIACFLHVRTEFNGGTFLNNMIFISMTSAICVTASYYYTLGRKRDFSLRTELDARNRELTELDSLKSKFFANVSHELRTPLTLILAPVEDLLRDTRAVPETAVRRLGVIQRNGVRLLRLIDDLLDLIRFENKQDEIPLEPLDVGTVISGIVASVQSLAEANELTLEVGASAQQEIYAYAHEPSLERVLLNLLSNAVKFTRAGGVIQVNWKAMDESVVIEVVDNGVGIADSELPHVFDRFRQAGTHARSQGLGIGLALAKELVERQRGRIDVTSKLASGTCFRIQINRADAEAFENRSTDGKPAHVGSEQPLANSPLVIRSQTNSSSNQVVLVVDDEPEMLSYLVSTLSADFQVIAAKDGEEGFRAAREHKPHLALLDLMLPGASGLDLCRMLRETAGMEDLKVLMLTARMDETAKLTALEAGVDDFLTKPFSSLEILTRIKNLLKSRGLQTQLRDRNRELTETLERLRATEAQLIQSEKMNALGALSAGLLHEINNPVNAMLMAIECAKLDAPDSGSELGETLTDLEGGVNRISAIVSDLRTFAYPETLDNRAPVFVKEPITNAIRFTANELSEIEIDDAGVEEVVILGSSSQITQVLVNLLMNAKDALRGQSAVESPKISIAANAEGDRVLIRVSDNGSGIDQEVQNRIFEPFFTTKEVGAGMGLGLSVCHTIVKNHGGEIRLEQSGVRGTSFVFDLPTIG